MSDDLKPDTDEAIRFLEWLRPAGPWLLSAKRPDGPFETRSCADLDAAREWIRARNGRSNLYVMVNPAMTAVHKKAKKADVAEVAFLHVDLDVKHGPLQEGLERIRTTLAGFEPRPSGVTFSGGGYWAFWRLDEPLSVGGAEAQIAAAEAYNRQLEEVLGGDHCFNVDRVCRLPGTINLPDDAKRKRGRTAALASIVELTERDYPLHEFTAALEGRAPKGKAAASQRDDGRSLNDPAELDAWNVPLWTRAVIVQGSDPTNPDRWGGDRSKAVFAVACELARNSVPAGLIVGILTDPTWGISAHVLDQKRSTEYAWRQVGKAYDRTEDSWPMRSVEAAVDWINRRYFAALEGKRVTFYREQAEKLYPMDREAFSFELAGKDVIVGSPNQEKRVLASQLWTRDGRRRYYPEGLVLDPGRPDDGRAYNLWRGFGVEPRPGDWSLMRAHIETILARGDADHARYITNWAAWTFQNPAKPPGAALVFQGGEGVGKGVFAQALLEAFGHHGLHVRSMSQVTGRFNSHLRHCCLLYADEANAANSKEETGALKGLISERKLACEGKGKDLIEVDNHIHLVMASNEDWVVPAGKNSRRFAVFRVSPERQRDRVYFDALTRQMRSGGLEAMVHDMLAMDVSGFHPEHDRPDTDALAEQRAASLRGFERFWCDTLRSGEMPPLFSTEERGGGRVFVATSEVRDFAMQKMRRDDLTVSEVGGLFARLGFEKVDSGRPRGWIAPPLAEARRLWDRTFFPVPWDKTRTWALPGERGGDGGPY